MLSATSPLQVFLKSPFSVTRSSTSSCPLFRHLKKGAPHNLVPSKHAPEATGMLLCSVHLHIKLTALTEHRRGWSTGIHSQQGNPADKAPTARSHLPRSTTEGCLAFWLYPANFTTSEGARCPPVPLFPFTFCSVHLWAMLHTVAAGAPHFPQAAATPALPAGLNTTCRNQNNLHAGNKTAFSLLKRGEATDSSHTVADPIYGPPLVLHLALFEGFPSLPRGHHQALGESPVLQPQAHFVKPCTSEASLFRQLFVRQEQGLQAEKCGGQGSPNKNTESH